MTYDLFIGDRATASWSLRGWRLYWKFNHSLRTHMVGLSDGTLAEDLAELAPARLVPVMRDQDGIVIGDSLAMAETLAECHPDAGLWPADPAARGLARWMAAEMHSGFSALRNDCPMQLFHQVDGFDPAPSVRSDLERVEELWALARTRHGDSGPWLFGTYSLADVFFAPVAARIAGYGLPVGPLAQRYVDTTLVDTLFRQWRAMGLTKSYDPFPYDMGLPERPWPGPAIVRARAIDDATPENPNCPYSGRPSTHMLETRGRVFGFCNAFCRDKTVADPDAWPAFVALRDGA